MKNRSRYFAMLILLCLGLMGCNFVTVIQPTTTPQPTPTDQPTVTVTVTSTVAPSATDLPEGMVRVTGSNGAVEMLMPDSFTGGDADLYLFDLIDQLRNSEYSFNDMADMLENDAAMFEIIAFDLYDLPTGFLANLIVGTDDIAEGQTLDSYFMDLIDYLRGSFDIQQAALARINGRESGCLIMESTDSLPFTTSLNCVILDNEQVWTVSYTTTSAEFEQWQPIFEESIFSFQINQPSGGADQTGQEVHVSDVWILFSGSNVEIALPEDFVGGTPNTDLERILTQFRFLGGDYFGMADYIEQIRSVFEVVAVDETEQVVFLPLMTITSFEIDTGQSLDGYLDEIALDQLTDNFSILTRETTVLQGYEAVRLELHGDLTSVEVIMLDYYIREGSRGWVISYTAMIEQYDSLLPVFEESASTFRVLP